MQLNRAVALTSRVLPRGKRSTSTMAHELLLNIFYTLSPKMKERYLDTIACIKNDDPYMLEKADFWRDISRLPALRFGMRHIKRYGNTS